MLPENERYKTTLDQLEIKPTDQIERDQVLLFFKANYGWTEVMTAGNISCIVGEAKGRKTFAVTLMIAGLITNKHVQFRSQLTGNVALFDTEQGKFHVWRVTKRIEQMTNGWPGNLKVYGLRPLTTTERVDAIESYIYQHQPQIVFIDGIRDLITDINDAEQATNVVGKLMKWSYDTNCHICNIIHKNKADENARGHIGTELINKSETVLSVNKIKTDKEFSEVKSVYTRGKETEEFSFSIEQGLPVIKYIDAGGPYNYQPEPDDNPF